MYACIILIMPRNGCSYCHVFFAKDVAIEGDFRASHLTIFAVVLLALSLVGCYCVSFLTCHIHIRLSLIHRTPGHLSTVWSIFIWKTPWDILRPNGMHLKWYLPRHVLNVVSKELLCRMWILQKPFLASSLEYVVEPTIFSNVGPLWCLWAMVLLNL